MMAFPDMLVGAAEKAGMKVPPNPDDFDPKEYPHFQVFCNAQLCRRMSNMGEHWGNAKIIAAISDEDIFKVSLADLLEMGLSYAQ